VLEDTATNGLHYYNLVTKENKKLSTDIGRSLQRVPGKQAISFIKKTPGEWLIREYDAATKKIITIMPAVHNGEFIAWTKKGLALMSDGTGIYFAKQGNNNWQKIKMNVSIPLKNISRLAINEQNTKLAVVVAE
jgi:lipoprotein-anchoring transpeptidase ErfK/SrfK